MPTDEAIKAGWDLRRPLQLESLRRRLPDENHADDVLRRIQRYRENLDAVVYALSSRALAAGRREHLTDILERHREALDGCLAELGFGGHRPKTDPLWHYHQLDPVARAHLAAILGVPEEPPFFDVLDVKAQEYLAQYRAFEMIVEEDGFRERRRLARTANRGSLMLTLSGSLIVISEPDPQGGRRYLYQNIYGNAHPPQGVLVLDRDIHLGRRIRSVELTTSPVRLLRVASRRVSWEMQYRTFEKLSKTFTSLAGRRRPGHVTREFKVDPAEVAAAPRRRDMKAAKRVLRDEYGDAYKRFDGSRERFAAGEADAREEAELLTLCHYLQTGARDFGFTARAVEDVREVTTEDGHAYRIESQRPISITRLPKGGAGMEIVYMGVSLGRQMITNQAPLAFIGKDGKLVEVTTPVVHTQLRDG